MQMRRAIQRMFQTACGGAALSAAALLSALLRIGALRVIGGICFWGGLLLELAAVIAAGRQLDRLPDEAKAQSAHMRAGIISFGKTKAGIAADAVFFIAAAVLAVMLCCRVSAHGAILPVLILLHLGFHFHCLCNGRVYRVISGDAPVREEK